MFRAKVVEKIKTDILCSVTFSRKSCRLWDNVEKYCTAGHATEMPMRTACWIPKATDTHSEYVIFIAFLGQERFRGRASVLRLYAYCLFS
jgi:hypothetical protein